jgi:hypothetical protein
MATTSTHTPLGGWLICPASTEREDGFWEEPARPHPMQFYSPLPWGLYLWFVWDSVAAGDRRGESLLGGGRFDGQRALKCRRCANLCIPPLVWGGVPSPQTLASEHDGAHRLL